MRDQIDEAEHELIQILEAAEPSLLRRALAHVAGRLAEAEGVPTARRMTQIIDQALDRLSAPLAS